MAVDHQGEVYAISKWTGNKTKDVRAKLGEHSELPTMFKTKEQIANDMTGKMKEHLQEAELNRQRDKARLEFEKTKIVQQHQQNRSSLEINQEERWQSETALRSEKFSKGFIGIWHRLTGKHSKIRQENELEVQRSQERDRTEKQSLIDGQLQQRQKLQRLNAQQRQNHTKQVTEIERDVSYYKEMKSEEKLTSKEQFIKDRIREGNQQIRGPTLERDR